MIVYQCHMWLASYCQHGTFKPRWSKRSTCCVKIFLSAWTSVLHNWTSPFHGHKPGGSSSCGSSVLCDSHICCFFPSGVSPLHLGSTLADIRCDQVPASQLQRWLMGVREGGGVFAASAPLPLLPHLSGKWCRAPVTQTSVASARKPEGFVICPSHTRANRVRFQVTRSWRETFAGLVLKTTPWQNLQPPPHMSDRRAVHARSMWSSFLWTF